MIGAMVVMMGVHRSGDAAFGRGGGMGLVQVEVIKVCSRGGDKGGGGGGDGVSSCCGDKCDSGGGDEGW